MILTELTVLLQETDALLTSPDPDPDMLIWEHYGQRRQEIFSRLHALFQKEPQGEQVTLRNVLNLVLEKDQMLLQQLELHLSRCRQELTAVAKARQAFKSSPPLLPHLLDCDV
jgi:hypothetical protein